MAQQRQAMRTPSCWRVFQQPPRLKGRARSCSEPGILPGMSPGRAGNTAIAPTKGNAPQVAVALFGDRFRDSACPRSNTAAAPADTGPRNRVPTEEVGSATVARSSRPDNFPMPLRGLFFFFLMCAFFSFLLISPLLGSPRSSDAHLDTLFERCR